MKLYQSNAYISIPSYIEQDPEITQKLCLNVLSYLMKPDRRAKKGEGRETNTN